ncbi:hypothetical protein [Leptolyngbya sp. FACHB-16]|uniref:hypothetical protein n=2 Tax=Leptolyngbya TaxID=47251 RepID=UPI0019B36595|nr:hypothetical protein [Leptolyngbya sp. FACHB-16]MBD2157152.1 hypothetical protein [Leptolyngbya sp. FACHB-16]
MPHLSQTKTQKFNFACAKTRKVKLLVFDARSKFKHLQEYCGPLPEVAIALFLNLLPFDQLLE